MRTTISNFAGMSESVIGGTCRNSMRALVLLMGAVMLVGLPGCLRFGFGDDFRYKGF